MGDRDRGDDSDGGDDPDGDLVNRLPDWLVSRDEDAPVNERLDRLVKLLTSLLP